MVVGCPACSQSNRLPASRLSDKARCAACKGPLLPLAHPVAVASAEDFDELVRAAAAPVLVDFWATWCGPCHAVAPELEKIARALSGQVVVAKVDTDALSDVAGRFAIRSIPTMILFRGGREVQRASGAMSSSAIVQQFGL